MSDDITAEKLVETLKNNISTKLAAGNTTGLAKEIKELRELEREIKAERKAAASPPDPEADPNQDPVLERLRVKRKYTMTDAALIARQQNAQKSTGPTSPEGKAVCSMNGWKHGQASRKRMLALGKPCKSTCPQYPCNLVDDGTTRPGQQCMDKQYMLDSIQAITKALHNGDLYDLKDSIALQLASTISVIDELQASILEYGVYIKSEKIGKEGQIIGYEIKPNPSLLPLSNLLKAAGVTMPDFMITPAALEKKKTDEDAAATIADIFRAAGNSLAQAKQGKQ